MYKINAVLGLIGVKENFKRKLLFVKTEMSSIFGRLEDNTSALFTPTMNSIHFDMYKTKDIHEEERMACQSDVGCL